MRPAIYPLLITLAVASICSRIDAADRWRSNADNGDLVLPDGFRAMVVADRLNEGRSQGDRYDMIRFLEISPSGDLYAKTFRGGIIAMRDEDGDGRMDRFEEFGSGGGTAIRIEGDWLYHSTNSSVERYRLKAGELVPQGDPEVIVSGLLDRGTHNAKSFVFDGQGGMIVEIGSPHNVFVDPDGLDGSGILNLQETQSGFWRFDANRIGQTLADGERVARGHRHALALERNEVSGDVFFVQMGRDRLNDVAPDYYDALDNAERVSEEMHRLVAGADYGWPATYYDPIKRARMLAPEYGGDGRKRAPKGLYAEPVVAFPAHWAPLQMGFYDKSQFPERYRGGAFVAFHGSWNRAPYPQEGYAIAYVPFDSSGQPVGDFEVFARRASEGKYRMGGVAVAEDGSLLVSETDIGRIWRITYEGEKGAAHDFREQTAGEAFEDGAHLYAQYCAACHMPDGSGAGHLQPALKGSAIVAGERDLLVRVVLQGSQAPLPEGRPSYGNVMPPYSFLDDAQVASLSSYLRARFSEVEERVEASEVSAIRAKIKTN